MTNKGHLRNEGGLGRIGNTSYLRDWRFEGRPTGRDKVKLVIALAGLQLIGISTIAAILRFLS